MKKLILTSVILFTVLTLHAQSSWNIGIQNGCATNISRFDSGNETANALFNNNPTKSFNLGVNFKYRISEKFALQTGINVSQIGFSYGMSKDYSLKNPFERTDDLSATTCISSIPVMVLMNTPVNCSNVRFVFGAGVTVRAIDNKWDQNDFESIPANEGGNANVTYMSAESKTVSAISPSLTWQIGIERMLRKGNSISFMYTGNQGLSTIAESTVNYTASDKNYSHTFINRGSFVNFSLAYNFMPFGTKKALKAQK